MPLKLNPPVKVKVDPRRVPVGRFRPLMKKSVDRLQVLLARDEHPHFVDEELKRLEQLIRDFRENER